MRSVHSATAEGKFKQRIQIGPHALVGDEPVAVGGTDLGPDPHEFLLAALATCTSMTVKMYADRKGWALRECAVQVDAERQVGTFVMRRVVFLEGDLDDAQRRRLLEIAEKCPVHKTLSGTIRIESTLAGA